MTTPLSATPPPQCDATSHEQRRKMRPVRQTALKANIHFPTDWILLRDAVRTLMKAALLIRREGLRRRMEAPEAFLARMNTLSLQMSQAARRAGSKKARKRVLGQRQLFLPGGKNNCRSTWVSKAVTDRGFYRASNSQTLRETGTYDASTLSAKQTILAVCRDR